MNAIEYYRRLAGIKQKDIAEAFGISQAAVSQWENGTRVPDLTTIKKLAEMFNVSGDKLLDLDKKYDNDFENKMSVNTLLLHRKRAGYTQLEIAKLLNVTKSAVSQWENGRINPTDENLNSLSRLYKVPKDKLLVEPDDFTEIHTNEMPKINIPPEYHKVPIVGSVACSWDKGFIEQFDGDYSYINDHLYNKYGDTVRVTIARGNSMRDMIVPGDLLFVVPASDIQNNDIVIATISDDEITAKKFHFNDTGGFDLIPVNPSYGIQSFTKDEIQKLPVIIVARVIEIRKGLRP